MVSGLAGWHLIVILVVLLLMAAVVVGIVLAIRAGLRRGDTVARRREAEERAELERLRVESETQRARAEQAERDADGLV